MVYLYYISCLRYTILVRNPRYSPSDKPSVCSHDADYLQVSEMLFLVPGKAAEIYQQERLHYGELLKTLCFSVTFQAVLWRTIICM